MIINNMYVNMRGQVKLENRSKYNSSSLIGLVIFMFIALIQGIEPSKGNASHLNGILHLMNKSTFLGKNHSLLQNKIEDSPQPLNLEKETLQALSQKVRNIEAGGVKPNNHADASRWKKRHNIHSRSILSYQEKGSDPEKGTVRLLCWILADPHLLYTKIIHQKATWGRKCDKLLVLSSKEDKDFPAIGLPNTQEGREHIDKKAKSAWKYIYENYINEFDFFIKTDPDTYLVVENLRQFLSDKDFMKPHIYGHIYDTQKGPFIAGGPGEVLTRAALQLLVTEALEKHEECMTTDGDGTTINNKKLRTCGTSEPSKIYYVRCATIPLHPSRVILAPLENRWSQHPSLAPLLSIGTLTVHLHLSADQKF